jgi:glycerol-3-phosphate acyltransferase PlsY
VATALGCLLAISWTAALASLGVFALIVVPTRLVSLAGIGGALTAPVFMLCFRAPGIHTGFVAAAVALLVVRHLPNLKRLLAGKEPRFGQRVSLDGKEEG